MRPYWRGWVGFIVLNLCFIGLTLVQPWPLKILVDQVLAPSPGVSAQPFWTRLPGGHSTLGIVSWLAFAGLLIFAVSSLADILLTTIWIRVGQGMVYDLATDLFASIQRRSLLFHARHPVGDSMSRVTGDSWCINSLVDTVIITPLQCVIFLASAGIVMAKLDLRMTLVSFAAAPLMACGAVYIGGRLRQVSRDRRESESRMQSCVQQTLNSIQVVQAFGQEEREHRRFQTFADEVIRNKKRAVFLGNFSSLWTGLIVAAGTGIVIVAGGHRILAGELTFGGLLVFLAYLAPLQDRMGRLVGVYMNYQAIGAQVDRVAEVLEAEPEVQSRSGASPVGPVQGSVKFQNVMFGYDAQTPLLSDVNLDVRPGERVAIVGPTGAGKSTLVGLIPRFFDPHGGMVMLDGRDLRELELRDLRRNISLVLQEPMLLPITIAENIAYGRPDATLAEIQAAAEAASADAFIRNLPEGYDTSVGERGATLSGGERQRLSIARALLKNAPILILDEPTSALDTGTERALVGALDRLMAGRTTFIVAHRLSTIRRADRIIVLERGRITEQGTHDELVRSGRLYSRMYGLQNGDGEAVKGSTPVAAGRRE